MGDKKGTNYGTIKAVENFKDILPHLREYWIFSEKNNKILWVKTIDGINRSRSTN